MAATVDAIEATSGVWSSAESSLDQKLVPATEDTAAASPSIVWSSLSLFLNSEQPSTSPTTIPSPSTAVGPSTLSTLVAAPLSTAARSTTLTPSTSVYGGSPSVSTNAHSISWGPAITAAPLPTGEASSETKHHQNHGLTRNQEIGIAVAVICGVMIVGLLLFFLYRRQKRANSSRSRYGRRKSPSTATLTHEPFDTRLTALPIHCEWRYSVHSSRHPSAVGTSVIPGKKKNTLGTASRTSVRPSPLSLNAWKNANPPTAPATPIREAHTKSFLFDASPTVVQVDGSFISNAMEGQQNKALEMSSKSVPMVCVKQTAVNDLEGGDSDAPGSPRSQHSKKRLNERWSWTNSQAPPTPRLAAPSVRSSIGSLPRFKRIRSWARTQQARVEEERLPNLKPRMPKLKNKASVPKLGPAPIFDEHNAKPGSQSR
ncbi:hypothetical protein LTR62_000224 [Meristemomyces frigidus]|uniref:Mid2 domain-containing protein n=1 Tax=Meristemomyces frigidus TaxID=1508187 RepID=A0AAN7TR68_9PEZI|nr:hypothetical protein LTR62_000224 [Meristemomyces frigidus]